MRYLCIYTATFGGILLIVSIGIIAALAMKNKKHVFASASQKKLLNESI